MRPLLTERITNAAIKEINSYKVDCIECNYLNPFLAPSVLVSSLCDIPLIVRPAGSDYHKFLTHSKFSSFITKCLSRASRILLPKERIDDFKSKLPSIIGTKIIPTPRYIPDPSCFYPHRSPKPHQKQILFVGKTNQYWKLRGLDTLIRFLELNREYAAKFIVDGTHIDEFTHYLNNSPCAQQIHIHKGFIPPQAIPNEIAKSFAVWNVILPGGIPDFPNTHWETIFSGKISIVSHSQLCHPDMTETPKSLTSLIVDVDKILSPTFTFGESIALHTNEIEIEENISFSKYLSFHHSLYEGVL